MTSFAGKVVLITGAARGIGADTARRLARRGARLVLVGMEPERLLALAAELGDGHSWHHADVTDQRALDAAVAAAVARHGGLDIVIANAGIASLGTVAVADVEALVRVLDVNLAGVLRTVKATLPHIRARRGYYLLVSSAAAFSAMPGLSAYAASKAGVEQLGNVLRLELLADGVDVGTAHMTWIDTDMVRDATRDLSSFRRTLQRLPGPFGTVTSCDACAAAFEDACEGRRRRVFVPGSLRVASLLRPLLASRLLQWLLRRDLTPMLHDGEREMAAVGRAFGEHSVGMGPDRAAIPLSSDSPSLS
ncbi:MAG: SDR family oxidoreductase [Gemmatimonadota bacterium]|nr:SDR family oxidoreductase [Gemmatimonadota bacterium]